MGVGQDGGGAGLERGRMGEGRGRMEDYHRTELCVCVYNGYAERNSRTHSPLENQKG